MINTTPKSQPVCSVCLSTKSVFFQECNGCTLYRCHDCQTVYMFPHITADQSVDLYNASILQAKTEQETRLNKKMRRSRSRAKRLKRHSNGNRFLDIGSNVGFMVEAAREAGFAASGVELDPNYVKIASERFPQNTFSHGFIEDYKTPDGGYDMVYCSEVIEHVPDPRSFAAAVAKQIAPGGKLFITTPDISHWRTPKNMDDWDAFCPPAHCLYFTPNSLKNLFEENGLRLQKKFLAMKPGIKMLFERP